MRHSGSQGLAGENERRRRERLNYIVTTALENLKIHCTVEPYILNRRHP